MIDNNDAMITIAVIIRSQYSTHADKSLTNFVFSMLSCTFRNISCSSVS